MTTPPRRGRPPKAPADVASGLLRLRVRPDQLAAYRAAATAAGQTMTAWVLAALDRIARQ